MNPTKHLTMGGLFAGVGGFELAAVMAGILPLWSTDIVEKSLKKLSRNLKKLGIEDHISIPTDIKLLDYEELQTGFDNSIDHSMFGHWQNPEYQELCQEAEMIEREKQENNKQPKDKTSSDEDDWLPF